MKKNPRSRAATFRSAAELYHADTCEPLEAATNRREVKVAAWGRDTYPGLVLPVGDLREVRSVGFWDANRRQNWGLNWHRNEGIEFTFLSAGKLPFALDQQAVTLIPGDLTITRPWQRHRVGDPLVGASRLTWLILDVGVRRPNQSWRWPKWLLLSPDKLKRLTYQLRHNEQITWQADREIARCFEAIGTTVKKKPSSESLTLLKILINELLIALTVLLDKRRPRLDRNLSSGERTVELFLKELALRANEPWTLETMAKQCGLGRSYFSLYCRKLTNRTPIEHLTTLRLELACQLLQHDRTQNITDIAYTCGFQSSQYFATVFAKYIGMSPLQWRLNAGATGQPPTSS